MISFSNAIWAKLFIGGNGSEQGLTLLFCSPATLACGFSKLLSIFTGYNFDINTMIQIFIILAQNLAAGILDFKSWRMDPLNCYTCVFFLNCLHSLKTWLAKTSIPKIPHWNSSPVTPSIFICWKWNEWARGGGFVCQHAFGEMRGRECAADIVYLLYGKLALDAFQMFQYRFVSKTLYFWQYYFALSFISHAF